MHDVPLLVENKLAPAYDLVVVVEADQQVRLARLEARGMPAEEARRRMASQASDEERREVADVVIDNSGSVAELESAVDQLWQRILALS